MRLLPGLTPGSHEWSKLKAYLEREIQSHLSALEQPSFDIDDTQFLRGQIASLRRIISDVESP